MGERISNKKDGKINALAIDKLHKSLLLLKVKL